MSLSSTHKLRTKTSDLADFLRGGPRLPILPPDDVQQPTNSTRAESLHSIKSKRPRMLFLGRSRKKSISSTEQPSPTYQRAQQELPLPPNTTRKSFSNGHVVLMISPSSDISYNQSLPGPRTGPVSNNGTATTTATTTTPSTSSASLAAKFAAHFTPTKSRIPPVRFGPVPKIARPARKTSVESLRSRSGGTRSPVPRAKHPTITLSLAPPSDPLESQRYALSVPVFTRSPRPTTSQLDTHPSTPSTESTRDDLSEQPHLNTIVSNTPSTSLSDTSSMTRGVGASVHSAPQTPLDDAVIVLNPNSGTVISSPTARPSAADPTRSLRRAQHSASVVKVLETALGTPVDLDSGEESDGGRHRRNSGERRISKRWTTASCTSTNGSRSLVDLSVLAAVATTNTKSESPRLPTRVPPTPQLTSSSSSSSLCLSPGLAVPGPPAIPLPRTPDSHRFASGTVTATTGTPSSNLSVNTAESRPRAHTISIIPPSLMVRRPSQATMTSTTKIVANLPPRTHSSSPSSTSSSTGPSRKAGSTTRDPAMSNGESRTDTPSSSREELQQALAAQMARFDELAARLVAVTQKHREEKAALELRIGTLEADAEKREKELQGLRWLVMNGTGAAVAGLSHPSSRNSASTATPAAIGGGSTSGDDNSGGGGRLTCKRSTQMRKQEERKPTRVESSSSLHSIRSASKSYTRPRSSKATPVDGESPSVARPAGVGGVYRGMDSDSVKTARRVSSTCTLPIPVEQTKAAAGGSSESSTSDSSHSVGDKRSSISSFSSAASSASSMTTHSVPALSKTPSLSNLSAIPECVPPTGEGGRCRSGSGRSSKARHIAAEVKAEALVAVLGVIQDAERRERERNESRRSSRALRRVSGASSIGSSSSSSSSTTAAAIAYSNNLKRSRPPSFAQVMDSQDMAGVLEKLKAFGGEPEMGTTSATTTTTTPAKGS